MFCICLLSHSRSLFQRVHVSEKSLSHVSRFTNFVFPLLEWLSVLVTTEVSVKMHKIHVKKDSSELKFVHRVKLPVCVTHDKILVLL